MHKHWFICVIINLVILAYHPALAYEEIQVEQGGAIVGQVTLFGGQGRPMAFNLVTIPDPVYCGRISTGTGWRIVEDFIVDQHGGLRDAIVVLEGVHKGKSFKIPAVNIEAKDCEFFPFVNVLRNRDKVSVTNMDPVEHDIQGYETARIRGARVLFNRPLPMNPFHQITNALHSHTHLPGKPMIETIHLQKERNIFVMQCGFHPYMFSWGMVLENPYYAITGEDGRYEIPDIPPGQYMLRVWHPGTKTFLAKEVTIAPHSQIQVNFEYEAPKGRRSVHEMQDNPHFGLEILPEDEEIIPSLRLQLPS